MLTLHVILIVLAVALVAMGRIEADRIHRGCESFNPSAPEISGSAFVAAHAVLSGTAGAGAFSAFQLMSVTADAEWSHGELSSMVSQATAAVDQQEREPA
ncbi:hypothetical protein [Streptomyces sp. NPDC014623]|uniref:hypothetical protein n=1 Tax=Streptomyces sp. NPDC014623 TaxID=3364875 RepID=UPI0036FA6F5D